MQRFTFFLMQMRIKDRDDGAGFDKDGHFVPQHMRGPDVALSRGKCSVVYCSVVYLED